MMSRKMQFLEALHTEIPSQRVIRKPRALKRPGKPGPGMFPQNTSTGSETQYQQTHRPAHLHDSQPSTLLQSVQPQSQAAMPPAQIQGMPKRDHRQPFSDLLASVSPTQVQRGPQLTHSASTSGLKKDNENPTPQMPVGWTEEMTELVRVDRDDDTENIEMIVRIVHDFHNAR